MDGMVLSMDNQCQHQIIGFWCYMKVQQQKTQNNLEHILP